jgi:eukaryotic-like serine/threonine-protein kinase
MSSNYEILNQLSSGGNGDLFLAKCHQTGVLVVVKFLRETQLPHARKAFEREVRILMRKVDGFVGLICADTKGPRPYYIMPYYQAGSLTKWAGRLSASQLALAASEIARALQNLHVRGIAHGDLKPDNILVSSDGHCHVGDPLGNGWGCTVLFASHCGGTPGYWAPEVKAGSPISAAGDVYSFGAMLYHLLTGVKPRDGERLDLLVRISRLDGPVVDAVAACCHPVASSRPTVQDCLQILQGNAWERIKQERRDALHFVLGASAFIGLVALIRRNAA